MNLKPDGVVANSGLNESLKAEDILKTARELPAEDLPDFIGRLEAARATAWARLTAPAPAQLHDEIRGGFGAEVGTPLGDRRGDLW